MRIALILQFLGCAFALQGSNEAIVSNSEHLMGEIAGELQRDLQLLDLPPLQQTEKRILVAITVADTGRPLVLINQLVRYSTACELGYEIHIVLVTYTSWLNNTAGVYERGRYTCSRLAINLPIVVFIDPVQDTKLAATHRTVFYELRNQYDYYISQEDDIGISYEHIAYFDKWSTYFDKSKRVPGFILYEIPTRYYNLTSLYQHTPIIWKAFTSEEEKEFQIIHDPTTNQPFMMVKYPWVPAYMLSRNKLNKVVHHKAWFEDKNKPWDEFNTHFQHLWLTRYYKLLIPIGEDMQFSFLHHVVDKYVQNHLKQLDVSAFQVQHDEMFSTLELYGFIENCFNMTIAKKQQAAEYAQWKMNMTYFQFHLAQPWQHPLNISDWGLDQTWSESPCQACLSKGKKGLRIRVSTLDSFAYVAHLKKSSMKAMLKCDNEERLRGQLTAVCKVWEKKHQKGANCNSGYNN